MDKPAFATINLTLPESLAAATRWLRPATPKTPIPVHWDGITIGLDYPVVGHVNSIVTDGRYTDIHATIYSGMTNCHALVDALDNTTHTIGIRTTTTRTPARVTYKNYPTINYIKETLTALTITTNNLTKARWTSPQLRISVHRNRQTATI